MCVHCLAHVLLPYELASLTNILTFGEFNVVSLTKLYLVLYENLDQDLL